MINILFACLFFGRIDNLFSCINDNFTHIIDLIRITGSGNMTDVIKNLAKNLKQIFEQAKTNPTRFCELCADNGVTVGRSTLSRLFTEDANIGIAMLNDIAAGIRLLPGFDWVTPDRLIADEMQSNSVLVDSASFSGFIGRLMVDLDELDWIELKNEISTISDVAALLAKQYGIEVARTNQARALKSV